MAALGWLSNLGFAGSGSTTPTPEVTVTRAGGGSGAKRKKYPRRVFVDGQVVVVRNADEERGLLRAMADRASDQAAIAAALESPEIAKTARAKAVKLIKRIEAVDDREAAWLQRLRDEDEEILTILLH